MAMPIFIYNLAERITVEYTTVSCSIDICLYLSFAPTGWVEPGPGALVMVSFSRISQFSVLLEGC